MSHLVSQTMLGPHNSCARAPHLQNRQLMASKCATHEHGAEDGAGGANSFRGRAPLFVAERAM
jgi:hypothetical protein